MITETKPFIHLSIKDAASMLGVTASTIRNWEKYGLFTAKRAPNGYRYFDFNDIETLKQVRKYMMGDSGRSRALRKLNAIREDNVDPVIQKMRTDTAIKVEQPLPYSGVRWKQARLNKRYTLEEVASAIDISVSYLSKIENNYATPSYEILSKLADFYNESLVYFIQSGDSECSVIHSNEAPVIEMGYSGIDTRQLSSLMNRKIYPVEYTLQPGSGSGPKHTHNGEEFVYILSGRLTVYLNETEAHILQQGDAMAFKASTPHRYINSGKRVAHVLWIHAT